MTAQPLPPSGVYVAGGELRAVPDLTCPCGRALRAYDAAETDEGWRIVCQCGHEMLRWRRAEDHPGV
jgi:hypothetical protein